MFAYYERGTRLSHLFFADDNLLFCKANIPEWIQIREVLDIYERASGQKLNKDMTFMFFSRNTNQETKAHIMSVVKVSISQCYEKYLGLLYAVNQPLANCMEFLGTKSHQDVHLEGMQQHIAYQGESF